jgi:hypothetical protein
MIDFSGMKPDKDEFTSVAMRHKQQKIDDTIAETNKEIGDQIKEENFDLVRKNLQKIIYKILNEPADLKESEMRSFDNPLGVSRFEHMIRKAIVNLSNLRADDKNSMKKLEMLINFLTTFALHSLDSKGVTTQRLGSGDSQELESTNSNGKISIIVNPEIANKFGGKKG